MIIGILKSTGQYLEQTNIGKTFGIGIMANQRSKRSRNMHNSRHDSEGLKHGEIIQGGQNKQTQLVLK